MGKTPCCDKAGIKKGPWTPEEDIMLVSYIQEHGPGNWRLIPTYTGLMRCSKSCRLRWTNYLRPGIKRGNFTHHEEGIIIQLQALLGNRWAAIASYLPQRTDNDIKNYWNTHLKKKKTKKHQGAMCSYITSSDSGGSTSHELAFRGISGADEIGNTGSSNTGRIIHSSSTYASNAENISRLLEGWMRSSPKPGLSPAHDVHHQEQKESITINTNNLAFAEDCFIENQSKVDQDSFPPIILEEINSSLPPLKDSATAWYKQSANSGFEEKHQFRMIESDYMLGMDSHQPPISFLEKCLLEENTDRVDALLELSVTDCCYVGMF